MCSYRETDDDGDVYFHNTETTETVWTRPEGFTGDPEDDENTNTNTDDAPPVPVRAARVDGTDWTEITTADGQVYYHNEEVREVRAVCVHVCACVHV